MEPKKIWESFVSLPAEAQQQVADFIDFLLTRYGSAPAPYKSNLSDLNTDEFVGMWRDRDEMSDCDAWLRDVRRREWS